MSKSERNRSSGYEFYDEEARERKVAIAGAIGSVAVALTALGVGYWSSEEGVECSGSQVVDVEPGDTIQELSREHFDIEGDYHRQVVNHAVIEHIEQNTGEVFDSRNLQHGVVEGFPQECSGDS